MHTHLRTDMGTDRNIITSAYIHDYRHGFRYVYIHTSRQAWVHTNVYTSMHACRQRHTNACTRTTVALLSLVLHMPAHMCIHTPLQKAMILDEMEESPLRDFLLELIVNRTSLLDLQNHKVCGYP